MTSVDSRYMQAIVFEEFKGQPKMMARPVPKCGDREVLVRIHASGVNPVDELLRRGDGIFGTLGQQFPIIMGVDLSGTVAEVGKEVKHFKEGDPVYCHKKGGNGTYAEYAVVSEDSLALKPKCLRHVEASAVPCAAITAYQVLVDVLKIRPGDTILITGAAGGVGGFAVQIAKYLGARVIATASSEKCEFLRKEIGIEDVIDYQKEDFVKATLSLIPGGVDAAFTTIGGDTKIKLPGAVKDNGKVVWISSEEPEGPKLERGITGSLFSANANGETLTNIGKLIELGKIKVFIQKCYPFYDAEKALSDIGSGRTKGKLVIEIIKDS